MQQDQAIGTVRGPNCLEAAMSGRRAQFCSCSARRQFHSLLYWDESGLRVRVGAERVVTHRKCQAGRQPNLGLILRAPPAVANQALIPDHALVIRSTFVWSLFRAFTTTAVSLA